MELKGSREAECYESGVRLFSFSWRGGELSALGVLTSRLTSPRAYFERAQQSSSTNSPINSIANNNSNAVKLRSYHMSHSTVCLARLRVDSSNLKISINPS